VIFVIDSSGSVSKTYVREKELVAGIIREKLRIGPNNARVAVIRYAGPKKAFTVFSFNTYTDAPSMIDKLLAAPFISGITYTNEALKKAEDEYTEANGARPGGCIE
jgi:uncharacterized protein YegL